MIDKILEWVPVMNTQHIIMCFFLSIVTVYYWFEHIGPTNIIIRGKRPFTRKPFNCQVCLPVWIFFLALPLSDILGYSICAALLSGITTAHIIAWKRKFLNSQINSTASSKRG
jgi:hypothetical protein